MSALRFAPDGRRLFAATGRGFRSISVATGTDEARSNPTIHANALAVAPDGRRVVHAGPTNATLAAPSTLVGWTVAADAPPAQAWLAPLDATCVGLAFFPDGERFAAVEYSWRPGGGEASRLAVFDSATGRKVLAWESPNDRTVGLDVSPTGEQLVTRAGSALLVWDPDGPGGDPRKVGNTSRKHFTDVAFHPSGRYLAATSNDATVKLYDTATWAVARTFTWDVGRLRSVAFSPDGALAAVGSDTGRIVVWDVDL